MGLGSLLHGCLESEKNTMKRFLGVGLLLLVFVIPTWAKITPETVYGPGTVKTDSIRWRASGSTIPGTLGVRVDTVVAAADDTSSSIYSLAGCRWAAVSYVFSQMGANATDGHVAATGLAIIPQTGPDPAGNIWVSQSAFASSLYDAVAADTCTVMLIQPDSLDAAVTTGNFRTQSRGDYARARVHGFVRFVIVNTGTTNDTTMVKGIVTRIW